MPTIRASSLSSYSDCPRRSAAKLFREEIETAGYTLNAYTPQHVGAIVGNAIHEGIKFRLTEKKNTGILGNETEAKDLSLENLNLNLDKKNHVWDSITNTQNEAEQQTLALLKSCENILQHVKPVEVEQQLECKISDKIVLSGCVDVGEKEGLIDWKSGKIRRANGAQYGAYSLLLRSHGFDNKSITEVHMQRVKVGKIQPNPLIIDTYDVATCENTALSTINHIARDHQRFVETSNSREFLANPSSMLCDKKYCSAWGTDFCREHKPK